MLALEVKFIIRKDKKYEVEAIKHYIIYTKVTKDELSGLYYLVS